MLPHIKHLNLWSSPSRCRAPENLTAPDTSLGVALSSFQLLKSPAGSLLDLNQTMEAFLVLLLGFFHLVFSMDMDRNRHWARSTCWRAFSLLEGERASPSVLQRHKALWNGSSTLNHQDSTGRCRNLHTPSSGAVQSWPPRMNWVHTQQAGKF